VESDVSDKSPQIFENLNPNRILPIYNPSDPSKKLLNSEILAEALLLFKSMLQVLSARSF
jgi:hypothetical protein